MLLPQTKEREYRFKLALRMGLPIFALILAFISSTFIENYESLPVSFYFISIILLTFSIYFIFFLIYNGFEVKITDLISGTFTREYLYSYLKKELSTHNKYTLILISIDNLANINTQYGMTTGDKIIKQTIKYITEYLNDKNIENYPMGHLKGGDYIIGLKGDKEQYTSILDLFCLKSNELKIDNIEVGISGAITDTSFLNDLDYLIENLFEIQDENKSKKSNKNITKIKPSDLEKYVIDAIKNKEMQIITQEVFDQNMVCIFKESFTRLKTNNEELLYPKLYMKTVKKLGLILEHDILLLKETIMNFIDKTSDMYAINISPISIRNYKFINQTKEIIEQNPQAKDKIIFILTESEYYTNIVKYNEIIQSFRKLGIKIAIDRLGSLHTSFLYLRELDVDIVRFDSVYKNEKYKDVIEGFNLLAHNKGIKTWLKMIENEQTKEFANNIKVDYIQGKALAKLN